MFRALEYPAEMAKQEFHRERLLTERWNLIRFVSERSNGTDLDVAEKLLSDYLAVYERVSSSCQFHKKKLQKLSMTYKKLPWAIRPLIVPKHVFVNLCFVLIIRHTIKYT